MKQGRFPCGRMSGVQSGLEPWATPTVFNGLQWSSMVFNGLQWYLQDPALISGSMDYSTFGRTHIWMARITGFIGPHFWIYGQL